MTRLGLCCKFAAEPIRFRTTTAAALKRLAPAAARQRLAVLCAENADALARALAYCAAHDIGCFRVNSQILPLKTHPQFAYSLADLPGGGEIIQQFRHCGDFARSQGLRLTFHPDQFVLLSALKPEIIRLSIEELVYQAEVAEWVGADVINIHAGGVYGDRPSALRRLSRALTRLPDAVRARLTLENDDRSYTPRDLLPFCRSEHLPFVYDAHHHRCLPDGESVERTTELAFGTWDREPLFHLSSPKEGWQGPRPNRHHDYIAPSDVPACWLDLDATIEIEAKAKELAIARLRTLWPESKVPLSQRETSKP